MIDWKNEIVDALDCIPSDDRDDWIRVGMSLKSEYGDDAYELWDAWSRSSEKYVASESRAAWRSFSYDRRGISIATFWHLASTHGYRRESGKDKRSRERNERREEVYRQSEANRKQMEKQEQQKRARRQAEAAQEALRIMDQAEMDTGHPYMVQKGLESEHVLHDADDRKKMVVPVFDAPGSVTAIQYIVRDGTKKFHPYGCKTSGGYFPLGFIMHPEMVWLCEGVATGYTIFRVLRDVLRRDRDMVCVCFSSHNMEKMAQVMRARRDDEFDSVRKVVVVADQDWPRCMYCHKTNGKDVFHSQDAIKNLRSYRDPFTCGHCGERNEIASLKIASLNNDPFQVLSSLKRYPSGVFTGNLSTGMLSAVRTGLPFIIPMFCGNDLNDLYLHSINQYNRDPGNISMHLSNLVLCQDYRYRGSNPKGVYPYSFQEYSKPDMLLGFPIPRELSPTSRSPTTSRPVLSGWRTG